MDAEFTLSPDPAPKILIIRRDNIGDLVCTAPLIAALRQRFPAAWLGALVNSYNAPVLEGNPDLDEMFVYTKAKHRSGNESLAAILWRRLRMMRRLRAMAIDDVIVATTSPQPRGGQAGALAEAQARYRFWRGGRARHFAAGRYGRAS
jgi:ADP-heptose:LPS heptosyltransferase